jgi:mannose/cellobiose epimerase-like protein (N-acyl-D-glucosamine 2-epimerase family)
MFIVDVRMRHPFAGYVTAADKDWEPLSTDLDQNPHMHLLEALQVLNDAGSDLSTVAYEEKVAKLMADIFYDRQQGLLREHFDTHGKPHATKGNVVEPGHQFEWYWLIRGGAQKAYGQSYASMAGHLFDWGVKHGIDASRGGVYDVCDTQGKVTQSTKRIWPTAEFLRAAACRWNKEKDQTALSLMNDQLKVFLKSYLNPSGWNESLNEDLAPNRADMPATTSYHLSTSYFDSAAMIGQ